MDNQQKRKYVMRGIMASGVAFVIVGLTTNMLCLPSAPLEQCIRMTSDIDAALLKAGFVFQALVGSTFTGGLVFLIFGKWKNN